MNFSYKPRSISNPPQPTDVNRLKHRFYTFSVVDVKKKLSQNLCPIPTPHHSQT